MKATAIIRDMSDQFWNGFGDSIPAFLSRTALSQFQRVEILTHEMPRNVSLKIGNGSFRDRVEWNQLFRDSRDKISATIEPRRGYKLITFELNR